MVLNFEAWLIDQLNREDVIGDLARVPSMQNIIHITSSRPSNEHKEWADIVTDIKEPGHIAVFNDAWQEYLLARQAAADFPN